MSPQSAHHPIRWRRRQAQRTNQAAPVRLCSSHWALLAALDGWIARGPYLCNGSVHSSPLTCQAYAGAPLSNLTAAMRNRVLLQLARRIDERLHPGALFDAPEGSACLEYDWVREEAAERRRILIKTAMMRWDANGTQWHYTFRGESIYIYIYIYILPRALAASLSVLTIAGGVCHAADRRESPPRLSITYFPRVTTQVSS